MGYVGTKVTQNIVSTSEITDGTITNDDLASDIAITTTGDTSLKGNVVINEDSADKDFRVESNGNANMLFVDGGNDKVGIGTGSPNDYYAKDLVVNSADEGGITILNSSTHAGGLFFADGTSANAYRSYIQYDHNTDAMVIATSATVRSTIASDGRHTMQAPVDGNSALYVINSLGSGDAAGIRTYYSGVAPDDHNQYIFIATDTGASRFLVHNDGDCQNHDNSFGAISDERIKQNIVDSNSQWDDIKAIKVRNFVRKDDVAQYGDKAWSQIGVVAQEVEAVCPKIIREANPTPEDIKMSAEFGTLYEDGDDIPDGKDVGDIKEIKSKVKSIGYSVLYMKAVKALQEAMARIETLETKVKALEDA